MHSLLRRLLLGAALLALVAMLPACDKKKSSSSGGGPEPSPPGPTGGDRVPGRPDSDATPTEPSPPIVFAGVEGPRLAAARTASNGNLRQIGIAFHNFVDTYGGGLPGGIYDASGKKLGLSWRVAILPFIEQDQLYRQFKLDEPWDGPNNKRLIDKMPKTYAVQGQDPTLGKTYYRSFSGPGTIFPPPPGGKAGGNAFGVKFVQISDGTSNTLAAVEARDPVIWTKPDELAYDASKPVPKVAGVFDSGFNAAFVDGAVRFLPKATDEKTLRGLITVNGGEVIQIP